MSHLRTAVVGTLALAAGLVAATVGIAAATGLAVAAAFAWTLDP